MVRGAGLPVRWSAARACACCYVCRALFDLAPGAPAQPRHRQLAQRAPGQNLITAPFVTLFYRYLTGGYALTTNPSRQA